MSVALALAHAQLSNVVVGSCAINMPTAAQFGT